MLIHTTAIAHVALLASATGLFVPQDEATAAPRSDVAVRIERRCLAEMEKLHARASFPGASLAIVLPGGEEVAVTVGVTDPDGGRALTPADRMLSGSIGKTYVAAMALHLASQDKLDLDAKARDFFADEDWFQLLAGWESFTLRHLLRHQSGLKRYVFDPEFFKVVVAEPDKVWEPDELLAYVFDHEGLFAPGGGWAYADTNYIVLGIVLEKVAGQSMYEYVAEHFLGPKGLVDTVPSDQRRIPGLVQGHVRAFKGLGLPDRALVDCVFVINPQFEWCGGGFCSTPLDLARWARMLYSGSAFEGDYLDTLIDAVPANPRSLGPGSRYGPACIIRDSALGEVRGHDGVMVGYQSAMGWFSEVDIAVAFQMNTDQDRKIGAPLPRLLVRFASIAAEELGLPAVEGDR